MARTELFSRKQSGGVFAIAGVDKHPGEIWFVHAGTGTNGAGYGKNPDAPFASIAYAFSSDSVVAGDVVYVLPGHTETVIAAGTITQDIAGVSVIGLGEGSNRPQVTFSTVNGASWLVSAANSKIKNIIGVGNKDGLTNPFDVTASDADIDIEWRDTSAAIEAVAVVRATTVSRLVVNLKYRGFIAGDAAARPVNLIEVTGARIHLDCYGVVSVAWVNFTTTASTDISVTGKTYTSGITNGSRNVVDTITGSTWYANVEDMSAGARYSGGSGAAMASDDISSANSSIVSTGVVVSTGNSLTTSVGVVVASTSSSAGVSSALSAATSVGVVVASASTSAGVSSALSAAVSVGVVAASGSTSAGVSSAQSAAVSVGVVASSATSAATSVGVVVASTSTSAGVSSATSAAVSVGVVVASTSTSAGVSSATSAAVSVGVVANAIGKPVGKASSLADNAIPNNAQAAGGLLATATAGDVYIEEVVFSKDGTLMTGPTSVEVSCDNVYGPNGADDILGSNVVAGFGAQDTVKMTGATVALKPFVLESGKKLYIHGNDAAGTSAGNLRYAIVGRALTAGATLV